MLRLVTIGLIPLVMTAGATAQAASGTLGVTLTLRKAVQVQVNGAVGPSEPLVIILAGAQGSVVTVSLPARIALHAGNRWLSYAPEHPLLTVALQAVSATLTFAGTVSPISNSDGAPLGTAGAPAADQYLTILFQ